MSRRTAQSDLIKSLTRDAVISIHIADCIAAIQKGNGEKAKSKVREALGYAVVARASEIGLRDRRIWTSRMRIAREEMYGIEPMETEEYQEAA